MAKEPVLVETRELGLDLGSTMAPGSDRAKQAAVEAETAADDGGKAKPAGVRRTKKLVKVGQHYIDRLLEVRAVNPRRSLPASPETMPSLCEGKPEARAELLRLYASAAAVMKKTMEMDAEILRQYDARGFAIVEMSDDED